MTAVRYLMNSETPSVFIDNSGEEQDRTAAVYQHCLC